MIALSTDSSSAAGSRALVPHGEVAGPELPWARGRRVGERARGVAARRGTRPRRARGWRHPAPRRGSPRPVRAHDERVVVDPHVARARHLDVGEGVAAACRGGHRGGLGGGLPRRATVVVASAAAAAAAPAAPLLEAAARFCCCCCRAFCGSSATGSTARTVNSVACFEESRRETGCASTCSRPSRRSASGWVGGRGRAMGGRRRRRGGAQTQTAAARGSAPAATAGR